MPSLSSCKEHTVPEGTESTSGDATAPPVAASPSSPAGASRRLLTIIMAAVFMVSAEARVIAPLLSAIAQEFHTSVAQTGLLITAYTIPYGLCQIIYGPLADRFSRQRVMGTALGLFALVLQPHLFISLAEPR